MTSPAYSSASLRFWAKARSFEGGDEANLLVSSNGLDWTVVKTWVNGDDDNIYYYYDIDLSAYLPSGEFWVAFQADMSGTGDQLYVDDLKVISVFAGAVSGLPDEDFENGDWSGGSNWLYDWNTEGDSSVTGSGSPYQGSYHLRMRRGNSYADRAADLSGQSDLRLRFQAKVNSLEGGDYVEALVSPDGQTWTTVYTWTSADSDNTYHFYDIDLSPYTMSGEFWIAFQSGMNHKNDSFYVDNLEISNAFAIYQIVSTAGDRTISANVKVSDSSVSILSWRGE